MKPEDYGLNKISETLWEGSPCENVKAKIEKFNDTYWHVFIRDDNPGVTFPIIGSVAKSGESALEFLKNYEGCP